MTEPVVIGSLSDGLTVRSFGSSGSYALFRLTKAGLAAEVSVYAHQDQRFDGLADYFVSMARDWRGWPGERIWTSLEGECTITAVHDGHIHLTISLPSVARVGCHGAN